jgi:hypothetical protein
MPMLIVFMFFIISRAKKSMGRVIFRMALLP